MKRRGFVTVILIVVVILLIGLIGLFGYAIYMQITGEGSLKINFDKESGISIGGYDNPTIDNDDVTTSSNMTLSGVNGDNTNTQNKINRNLYNQLSSTAKTIYSELYKNKENLKTGTYKVEFGESFSSLLSKEGGDEELKREYQSAIEALLYDNPEIFYLEVTNMYIKIEKITRITGIKYNVYIDNSSNVSYLAEGFYSKQSVDEADAKIEQAKNEILSLTTGKSDYEKIKIVHDYLIDNIDYDTTVLQSNIYNIYGALVSKKCVCEGYAKAFQYLMNELEIDNTIVIGTATNSNNETENHAWNYVKLDGNWYAIDVTWDDPVIIGGGKLSDKSRYQYFLRGSSTFYQNHVESNTFTEGGQWFTYPTLSVNDYDA